MDSFCLRILVVDSDQVSRRMVSSLIEQSGHEAIEASDGRDGLDTVLALRPDMVITQYALPGMNGIEMARAIRSASEDYRPYLILATGPEDRRAWREALDVGIDQFIDKPLRAETLAAHLRAGQRIARLQRENERYLRKLQQYSEELCCSNLRLRELAITDDLTGLPNRRYSLELMQHEWSATEKDEAPLGCMVIDLDGLKQINDEQGLERGDVVIKTVAAIMRKYLPPQDTVCRISGDEFLVICPGANLGAVMARGEKLMSLVGSFNIHSESHPLGLSIGVAERRPGVDDPQELINLAEQATHCAKRLGRNQVYSGHATKLRIVHPSPDAAPAPAPKRKARKQSSLWRTAESREAVAAR